MYGLKTAFIFFIQKYFLFFPFDFWVKYAPAMFSTGFSQILPCIAQ